MVDAAFACVLAFSNGRFAVCTPLTRCVHASYSLCARLGRRESAMYGLRNPIIPIILGEWLKKCSSRCGDPGPPRVRPRGGPGCPQQVGKGSSQHDLLQKPGPGALVPGVARAYHQRGGTWSDRHLARRAPPGRGARPCKFDLAIHSAQFRPSVRKRTEVAKELREPHGTASKRKGQGAARSWLGGITGLRSSPRSFRKDSMLRFSTQ
jgi:hypothetical protein